MQWSCKSHSVDSTVIRLRKSAKKKHYFQMKTFSPSWKEPETGEAWVYFVKSRQNTFRMMKCHDYEHFANNLT